MNDLILIVLILFSTWSFENKKWISGIMACTILLIEFVYAANIKVF